MYNTARLALDDYTAALIRETAPSIRRQIKPRQELKDWEDRELARIRAVLRRITSIRVDSPEDGEDIVQETLLTMTEKCPHIEIQKGLLIWGMGILRNKLGNYYRRNQRCESFQAQRGSGAEDCLQPPVGPSQESLLHYSELTDLIAAILSTFSERERKVLDLYLAGVPTNEIVRLFRPERYQNVVNWLHRGRKKLARELAKFGYGPPRSGRSRS